MDEACEIPWSDVEELLVERPAVPPRAGKSTLDNIIAFLEAIMVVGVSDSQTADFILRV